MDKDRLILKARTVKVFRRLHGASLLWGGKTLGVH